MEEVLKVNLNPKQNTLNPWHAVKPAYAYASKLLSCSAIIR